MSNATNVVPDGPPANGDRRALARHLRLPPPAEPLLALAEDDRAATVRLMDGGFEAEAVRALAHLLPIRRAVWWAVLCAWHGVDGQPSTRQDKALAAAVEWVREPSEPNRDAAESAAGHALLDNAAGSCASAAGLTGGVEGETLHVEDLPAAAAMVAQAVSFAVSQRGNAGLPVSFRQLLEVGLDLLDGKPLDLEPPTGGS